MSKLFLHGYTTQTSSIDQLLDIGRVVDSLDNTLNLKKALVRNVIKLASRAKLAEIAGIKIDSSERLFDNPDASYFGYWQRPELFEPFYDDILAANWRHNIDFLEECNREVVLSDSVYVLHVRKGDYLLKKNKKIFSDLNRDFYLKGLENVLQPVQKIIICTDDRRWVWENLFQPLSKICRQVEMSSNYGCQNWVDDFLLMRFSNNLIMSNSTFAWWAAFLNNNNIYFPRTWYRNADSKLKLNSWNYFGEDK
ncbi:alpha-1,2-fucosyltransferase [Amylibacter sp.]|nr:alpha-1,2-fucosyltransferase [Amylibacter sp.]